MKNILFILMLLSIVSNAQEKYITKTGNINFEASVPSFEEVAAKNNSVTAIINSDNGEIAALVLINAFRFKNALMEEHFNENYAESSKYPKATFKGKIEEFDINKLNANYTINGELTFHGVTKTLEPISVNYSKENSTIHITGNFKVKASDYNIEIPKIVKNKVSDEVNIQLNLVLIKK